MLNRVESILGRSPAPDRSLYRPPKSYILHNHKGCDEAGLGLGLGQGSRLSLGLGLILGS